ncbi:MAG: hypothetical protein M1832_002298 [Thelocarpon impressellum]|nr:MAG: hypothetical protein M1832_002298 [Thelocarpon impressellum]
MSTNIGLGECCLSGRVQQVFGWGFKGTRLLTDVYAEAGFRAVLPDVHDGDSLRSEILQDIAPNLKDAAQMSVVERAGKTASVASKLDRSLRRRGQEAFADEVRKLPGTGKVGVIGFCWSGRHVILLAGSDAVEAAHACHPSLLGILADIEPVKKPLSLAVGEMYSLLDAATVGKIEALLEDKGLRVHEDQVHGFSLRGEWSSERDREAMDDAQKQGIAWINKHLS